MSVKKSPLEALIEFPREGDVEERRELLRLNTDAFITAADRYGSRRHEFFDLLFSRVSLRIDRKLRRALAMAMAKSGVDNSHVKKLLQGQDKSISLILRRSATQTVPDLINVIRERTTSLYSAPRRHDVGGGEVDNCNRFSLPRQLIEETYRFVYFGQRHGMREIANPELIGVFDRTAKRFRPQILDESQAETRAELVAVNKDIDERVRMGTLTEDYVAELLMTQSTTEFTLAMCNMLGVDSATMQRLLNDTTWEALALACRAAGISRQFFTNLVQSMNRRKSDMSGHMRIISLYNKIPEDAATRVMRFWQVRATTIKEAEAERELLAAEAAAAAAAAAAAPDRSIVTINHKPAFGQS